MYYSQVLLWSWEFYYCNVIYTLWTFIHYEPLYNTYLSKGRTHGSSKQQGAKVQETSNKLQEVRSFLDSIGIEGARRSFSSTGLCNDQIMKMEKLEHEETRALVRTERKTTKRKMYRRTDYAGMATFGHTSIKNLGWCYTLSQVIAWLLICEVSLEYVTQVNFLLGVGFWL